MILSRQSADKMLRRMSLEIAERNFGRDAITIIGIRENGIHIARKIDQYLSEVFPGSIDCIELSMNKKTAGEIKLSVDTDLKGRIVLLADDVTNSGRTMLYAMQPLLQQYPAEIQTLTLVARTHNMFPVALDYTGLNVSTREQEHIVVTVEDGVITGAQVACL